MYNQGKYITGAIGGSFLDVDTAVCFSEVVGHDSFKNVFTEIYGAGFFCVDANGNVVVYGKSISLGGVESRAKEDAFLIRRALGMEPT